MLFEIFKNTIPELREKWDEYSRYYHKMAVSSNTILLQEGEVSKKAFFIEKGCLRVWYNHDGKDITFQFFFENEMVSSAESFRKNTPSNFTIETIEDCIIHWIHKDNVNIIFDELSHVKKIRDALIEGLFDRQLHYMNALLSFIRDTPEQRYLNLLKNKPNVVQRVPQKYIASYLGITPVSLSRIRNRI